jgi:hypothetical protein
MFNKQMGGVFFSLVVLSSVGCASKTDGAKDGGTTSDTAASDASSGIACYIADQFVCEENPTPTAEQEANLRVMCSSASGVIGTCPRPAFLGKCTVVTGKDTTIRRYYTGADGTYQQDFCVNTAHGVWSATF